MSRFSAATSAAMLSIFVVAGAAAAEESKLTPKVGKYSFIFHSYFNPIPKSLQMLDVWLPIPFEDEHQKVYQRVISAPYDAETTPVPDAAAVVTYMKGGPRGGLPMQTQITFQVERFEDLRNSFTPGADRPSAGKEKEIRERWLKPDRMLVIDREVKAQASKIVSGKKKPLDKARAIYDHLIAKMTLLDNVFSVRGAGFGNLGFALKEMKGDSVDMASAFVGLCRAVGIPARTVIGLKVPEGLKEGSLTGYHSWAEFYLEGIDWVPVDPAEGKRNPSRHAYYFGALDEKRLAISAGRDIILAPPQTGPPLNFFINPYWEGDRKEMPTPYVVVKFVEMDEIANKPQILLVPKGQAPPPPDDPQKPPR